MFGSRSITHPNQKRPEPCQVVSSWLTPTQPNKIRCKKREKEETWGPEKVRKETAMVGLISLLTLPERGYL
jgi:hypothetical protein